METKKLTEIKARISNRGKAKKFLVVDNLPPRGSPVPDTDYIYGECFEVEPVPVQRLKDEIYHKDYDFFVLPIITNDGEFIEQVYLCCLHKPKYYATTNLYRTCIDTSRDFKDREDFIMAMYNDEIWNTEDVRREGREEWLGQIWDATHRNMKDIIREMNSSQIKMCKYFGIPRRTLEDWCMGVGNPPTYVLIMMQEILGLVCRE